MCWAGSSGLSRSITVARPLTSRPGTRRVAIASTIGGLRASPRVAAARRAGRFGAANELFVFDKRVPPGWPVKLGRAATAAAERVIGVLPFGVTPVSTILGSILLLSFKADRQSRCSHAQDAAPAVRRLSLYPGNADHAGAKTAGRFTRSPGVERGPPKRSEVEAASTPAAFRCACSLRVRARKN